MMRYIKKINRICILIIILLAVFASNTPHSTTFETIKSFRINRDDHYSNQHPSNTITDLHEMSIELIFDETALNILLVSIKNMLILFSKLIIILSFYLFLLYIKSWIILVSHFKIKFFKMHYLHLKDDKKSVLSYQFS